MSTDSVKIPYIVVHGVAIKILTNSYLQRLLGSGGEQRSGGGGGGGGPGCQGDQGKKMMQDDAR